MPFADKVSPAPRAVRLAGALTALPGIAAIALAVILVVESAGNQSPGNNVLAEAGYYAILGAGTLACAIGLLLGKTWARSPAVVVALVLVGVGWYTTGPSDFPAAGVPFMVVGVLVIVLLFRAPAREWAGRDQ